MSTNLISKEFNVLLILDRFQPKIQLEIQFEIQLEFLQKDKNTIVKEFNAVFDQ